MVPPTQIVSTEVRVIGKSQVEVLAAWLGLIRQTIGNYLVSSPLSNWRLHLPSCSSKCPLPLHLWWTIWLK